MKKSIYVLPLLLISVLFISGCATQPYPTEHGPGFFVGLWHGITAPLALIGSIFMDIRIYEFPNSGAWYDFGFIIGIACWGGGAAASR
ncbi:MAG: hypothetical protein EB023_14050 [Flavobacteriia bacterium]|nr:hypothetical protein [Flavobacteriia bacterium]